MKRILTYSLPAILILGFLWTWAVEHRAEASAGPSAAELLVGTGEDMVIARVNGEPIMKSEFEAAVASLPERMRESMASPGGKRSVVEELIRLKVFEQEAEKRQLDKDPQIARSLELQRASVLANAVMGRLILERRGQNLQEVYERNKDRFSTIRGWQILVGFDDAQVKPGSGEPRDRDAAIAKASKLVERLRAGEDFEQMARNESDDPRTAPNGGDLGFLTRSNVPFDKIAAPLFALSPGEVSEPVESPIGIHVFRVTEKQVRPFEEVEPVLREQAGQLLSEEVAKDLRNSAVVELDPGFFGPSEN